MDVHPLKPANQGFINVVNPNAARGADKAPGKYWKAPKVQNPTLYQHRACSSSCTLQSKIRNFVWKSRGCCRDSEENEVREKTSGVPGWLSRLSVWLLIPAQVMISGFVSSSPASNSALTVWSLLGILPLSLSAPPLLVLSLSLTINK